MNHYAELPPLAQDPAHIAVVSTLARLRQNQRESFFSRITRSHSAALFLREVLYWLSPSNKSPDRPRSTVYRNGSYWMVRTQEEWKKELDISRTNLATIYRRCEDFIETDHFMFASQRRTHVRIKYEKMLELMRQDEDLQACLRSDFEAAQSRRAVNAAPCRPVNTGGCSPSLHSGEAVFPSLESTSECSPSAPSGAAAPEPPPPARRSGSDSVETAPAKPEVATFKQAEVILQAAQGAPVTEKLRRLAPYGERTRLVLGYLLIWQAECEAVKQDYRLCEAHFLQAGELADKEEVPLGYFCGTLKAAWKMAPREGFDPCFMSSHHSKKFTLFCKHFRRMEAELLQALND